MFERKVVFHPAYDRGPVGGNHCVEAYFALVGEKGAIVATVYTGWFLKETNKRRAREHVAARLSAFPLVAGIHVHSRKKKDVEPVKEGDCPFLGGRCFYYGEHGSLSWAQEIFEKTLIEKGEDTFWLELELVYEAEFGELAESSR